MSAFLTRLDGVGIAILRRRGLLMFLSAFLTRLDGLKDNNPTQERLNSCYSYLAVWAGIDDIGTRIVIPAQCQKVCQCIYRCSLPRLGVIFLFWVGADGVR